MRRLRYLVRINKDRDSDWGASVPDLPGCVATGKTIDAALRRIQVAIELHIQGLRADGVTIPRPRPRNDDIDPLGGTRMRGIRGAFEDETGRTTCGCLTCI